MILYFTRDLGYYMYIETSAPRQPGDKAWLGSPSYPGTTGPLCLNFFYHMNGPDIGQLKVYSLTGPSKVLSWNETGSQGDVWRHGRATIQSSDGTTKFRV